MEQNTATPPKGGKAVRTILEWTEEIVLAVVLIAVVFTFVCRVVTVTGTSMVPSFHEGDRVLVVTSHQKLVRLEDIFESSKEAAAGL